nr:37s ribosomal protein rsm22 [Colletotrichum truncatum]KAF6786341.1 37s ribosomal protein rsm22 [Colletotrichum truncatum]
MYVTGIPRQFLFGKGTFREASVAQRMSWIANRSTTRKEDIVYCLFGIFDVQMDLRYSEGRKKAFLRLQEEIMKTSYDDSILAWDLDTSQADNDSKTTTGNLCGPILATDPRAFANSRPIVSWVGQSTIHLEKLTGGFIWVQLSLHTTQSGQTYGLLKSSSHLPDGLVVGIPLRRVTHGANSDEYMRPEGSKAILLPRPLNAEPPRKVKICSPFTPRDAQTRNQRYGFKISPAQSLGDKLELVEVYPPDRWLQDKSLIITCVDFQRDSTLQVWTRFRHTETESRHVVVLLELEVKDALPLARCHVMTAAREASLQTLANRVNSMSASTFGKTRASVDSFHLEVNVNSASLETYQFYRVEITPLDLPAEGTVDVTAELDLLDYSQRLQDFFEESRNIGPRIDQIAGHIGEKKAHVDQRSAYRDKLLHQLDQLQREKDLLDEELGRSNRELRDLADEDKRLRARDEEILNQLSSPRQLLEYFDDGRNFQWHKLIFSRLSDILPTTDPYVLKMPDILERTYMQAVLTGNTAAIKYLHSLLSHANFEDGACRGILQTAVAGGSMAAIAWLLKAGFAIDFVDKRGMTALAQASAQGNIAAVQFLLEQHAQVQPQVPNVAPPILFAAAANQVSVLQLLLEKGANTGVTNSIGGSALAIAVRQGFMEVAKLLIGYGAAIDLGTPDGWSPLLIAVQIGNTEMVRLLLSHDASVHSKAFERYAVRGTQFHADPRVPGIDEATLHNWLPAAGGWTPLNLAAQIGRLDIIQLLLERKPDLEAKNIHGRTALLAAARNGHYQVAQLLLDNGSNIEARDNYEDTALLLAIREGYDEVTQLLLDKGATIHVVSRKRRTPLHVATINGRANAVRVLLEKGAGWDLPDAEGKTPLQYAWHLMQTPPGQTAGLQQMPEIYQRLSNAAAMYSATLQKPVQ